MAGSPWPAGGDLPPAERGGPGGTSAVAGAHGGGIWRPRIGKPGGGPPAPRSTPTVNGSRVYVLGQFGDLVCLQAATGQPVWRKNLKQDFGGQCGGWQYSESPLVDGNRVICTPGGARGTMVALEKTTAALLWQ